MRTITIDWNDLEKTTIPIGYVGENLRTRVRIECLRLFWDYPDATATMTVTPPEGDAYPVVVTKDGQYVIWEVKDSDLTVEGEGELQLSFVQAIPNSEDEIVLKTAIAKTKIDRSLMPEGEVPSGVESWIQEAEAVLASVPDTIASEVAIQLQDAEESGDFTPHFEIPEGGAETLSPGSDVVVTIDTEDPEYPGVVKLSFGIPKGDKGDQGDPGEVNIDDTAGVSDEDKTWSAKKLVNQFALKANAENPEFTGHISMGRKSLTTKGDKSTAEGYDVEASGAYSHGEGSNTKASANSAHAEGSGTEASDTAAHAEGSGSKAIEESSHAEGVGTIANQPGQHAGGRYNLADEGTGNNAFAEIIGNGTANNARSNARALDFNGNEYLAGKLYVECDDDSSDGKEVAVKESVDAALDLKAPKADPAFTGSVSMGRKQGSSVGEGSFVSGEGLTGEGKNSVIIGQYNVDDKIPQWTANTLYGVGDIVYRKITIPGSDPMFIFYICTTANSDSSFTLSNWRDLGVLFDGKTTKHAFVIGNGAATGYEKNIFAIDWEGNIRTNGDLFIGCGDDSTGGDSLTGLLSEKADREDAEFDNSISMGRKAGSTVGEKSVAIGYQNVSSGKASSAIGSNLEVLGNYADARGRFNVSDPVYTYPQWQANTQYNRHDRVYRTVSYGGITMKIYLECKTDHTSDSSYTTAESNNWVEIVGGPQSSTDFSPANMGTFIEIIGNGLNADNRANARTLDWYGNERLSGELYVRCNDDSSGGSKVLSEADLAVTTETQAIISEYWGA